MSSSDDSESSEHEISAPQYEIRKSPQQNPSRSYGSESSGNEISAPQYEIRRGLQQNLSSSEDSKSSEHEISAPRYEIPRSLQQNLSQITRLQAGRLGPSLNTPNTPSPIQRKSVNAPQTPGEQQITQHYRSTSHIPVCKQTNTQRVLHWLQANHWSSQGQLRCQSACEISNRNETNSIKYPTLDQTQNLVSSQIQPDHTLYQALQLKKKHTLRQREPSHKPQQPVAFFVKGLLPVTLDNGFVKHGCLYIDLVFRKPSKVAEVKFRNHYTAAITVFVREQSDVGKSAWMRSIARKVLMPQPAYADGGEDLVTVTAAESETEWSSLTDMRLVLRQPSARWRVFYVEKMSVFSKVQPPVRTLFTHPDGRREDAFRALMQLQTEEALMSSRYVFDSLPQNDESSDEDME